MTDNVARRTVLRLGLLAAGTLGVGGAIAGTGRSGSAPGVISKSPGPPYPGDEEERLRRYAGEFGGGSNARRQLTGEE